MKIDLSRLNLNLLVALDALLKERHVTNAGKKLHITQSAMSNLLKQLREIFQDQLFIRGQASRLIPTPYALQLQPRVIEALEKVKAIFQPPLVFKPENAKEEFIIGLSDYAELLFLPALIKTAHRQAPGINFIVRHMTYIKSKNLFEEEDIDLLIALHADLPDNLIAQLLFEERMVLLASKKNHLIHTPITPKNLAQADHLVIQFRENRYDLESEVFLKKIGMSRRAIVSLPNALVAPYILATTNLVTITVETLAKQFMNKFSLAYQPIPFLQQLIPMHLIWHPKNKHNAAHRWLRETVLAIAKAIH